MAHLICYGCVSILALVIFRIEVQLATARHMIKVDCHQGNYSKSLQRGMKHSQVFCYPGANHFYEEQPDNGVPAIR